MRIIVTGAAGFIGSHVSELLLSGGHDVLAIDDLSGGFRENVPQGVEFLQRSVMDDLSEAFLDFRPEVVFHLAAYAAEGLSHHIPAFNYRNNLVGTANVLTAAYRSGARHFVFTSSIATYGHPLGTEPFDESTPCAPCDPYGIAKLACEQHIRAFHEYYGRPNFTIFRPHNVFGPRQNISDPYRNVVGIFMSSALLRRPMPIFGDGTQTRSFSYITTVAECIAQAPWIVAAKNSAFNVGGDEPMSVLELARSISDITGAPFRPEFLPPRKEVRHAHCRHDLARKVFSEAYAKATGIKPGLELMAEFVRSHPIPLATECPSAIEIGDLLPPSWRARLPLPGSEP